LLQSYRDSLDGFNSLSYDVLGGSGYASAVCHI
jgi:hypothetical protein